MIRIIILAFLFYLLYRAVKIFLAPGRDRRGQGDGGVIDEMVQDPYCKTYIPLREAQRRLIDGNEYFFCSAECINAFLDERRRKNRA